MPVPGLPAGCEVPIPQPGTTDCSSQCLTGPYISLHRAIIRAGEGSSRAGAALTSQRFWRTLNLLLDLQGLGQAHWCLSPWKWQTGVPVISLLLVLETGTRAWGVGHEEHRPELSLVLSNRDSAFAATKAFPTLKSSRAIF